MNPCITCGRNIRFRSLRVSFNRKQGCSHWLEPAEGEKCICLKDYCCVKWKADKSKPTETEKLISRWNDANAYTLSSHNCHTTQGE